MHINFEVMTDEAAAKELGRRIEQIRLEKNMTQELLSREVGLSAVSYRKLVQGHGKLINFIAVMRALGRIDLVANFIPETPFSPLERIKLKGRERIRASGMRGKKEASKIDEVMDW